MRKGTGREGEEEQLPVVVGGGPRRREGGERERERRHRGGSSVRQRWRSSQEIKNRKGLEKSRAGEGCGRKVEKIRWAAFSPRSGRVALCRGGGRARSIPRLENDTTPLEDHALPSSGCAAVGWDEILRLLFFLAPPAHRPGQQKRTLSPRQSASSSPPLARSLCPLLVPLPSLRRRNSLSSLVDEAHHARAQRYLAVCAARGWRTTGFGSLQVPPGGHEASDFVGAWSVDGKDKRRCQKSDKGAVKALPRRLLQGRCLLQPAKSICYGRQRRLLGGAAGCYKRRAPAATRSGAGCYHGRRWLLPAAMPAATSGGAGCYQGGAECYKGRCCLLQGAPMAATSGGAGCYKGRCRLLQGAALGATRVAVGSYQRRRRLLQGAALGATGATRRDGGAANRESPCFRRHCRRV
jgi:hypothetical protein